MYMYMTTTSSYAWTNINHVKKKYANDPQSHICTKKFKRDI